MNKNELYAKSLTFVTDTYIEFRSNILVYGGLTLAGIATGIYAGRALRERQAPKAAEQTLLEPKVQKPAA